MLSQFSAEFSPCQSYSLNYSFRYGHALSLCANHVISHNRQRDNQLCLSVDTHAPTDIRVLKDIGDLTACFSQSDDFQSAEVSAVLVRSWSLSVPVQLHFLREGIPFRLMQQSQFVFNQPMINQFLTYFRLVCQPVNQPVSSDWLVPCLSFPPLFLSNREQQNVVSYVQQQGIDPDAICDRLNLKPYGKKRLKKRLNFILHLSRLSPDQPAGPLVIDILKETDAWEMIDKAAATREQSEEKKKTLQALAAYIRQQRCNISQFLAMIDEQQQSGGSLVNRRGVTISTVHGAKGLEWDRVVLAGLAEGHFPCYQNLADFSLKDEESERRLFYVALTRAKKQLLLLTDNGLNDDSKKKRSRFLGEMQLQASYSVADLLYKEHAAQSSVEGVKPERTGHSVQVERPELIQQYLTFFNSAIDVTAIANPVAVRTSYRKPGTGVAEVPYRIGDQLVHKAFGEGVLLEISAEQSNRITVEFKNGDKKVLLADRAPLDWLN
nr:3'-5' exonuclease [Oceanospirillum sediminis]